MWQRYWENMQVERRGCLNTFASNTLISIHLRLHTHTIFFRYDWYYLLENRSKFTFFSVIFNYVLVFPFRKRMSLTHRRHFGTQHYCRQMPIFRPKIIFFAVAEWLTWNRPYLFSRYFISEIKFVDVAPRVPRGRVVFGSPCSIEFAISSAKCW